MKRLLPADKKDVAVVKEPHFEALFLLVKGTLYSRT